jgi:PAS domain-containing protein
MEDCQERIPLQKELGRVVDALPGLVWTVLPDGRIDFVNQRWCEYIGINIDIEGRRRAEEALRARELDLRSIVDGIPGFVFTTKADGEIEFINQRILEVITYVARYTNRFRC